jgi:microtubule-associated protein-like 6
VGLDDMHTLAVWNWKSGALQASSPGHKERIFDVKIHPHDDAQLATCGVKNVTFWLLSGNALSATPASAEVRGPPTPHTACFTRSHPLCQSKPP